MKRNYGFDLSAENVDVDDDGKKENDEDLLPLFEIPLIGGHK